MWFAFPRPFAMPRAKQQPQANFFVVHTISVKCTSSRPISVPARQVQRNKFSWLNKASGTCITGSFGTPKDDQPFKSHGAV